MARDVEVNVTASDRTGNGLAAAERAFTATARHTEDESSRMSTRVGAGMVDTISGFAPKLSGVLTQAISAGGTAGGPMLVGAVAASAPFLGATIAAAVIGGVGVGGVAGGLWLASKDARVQAAANTVGDRIQARLEKAGGAFVQPAIDGVEEIGRAFDTIDVEAIFAKASRFVRPLVAGVSSAIESIGDGIEDIIDAAGPVMDALGDGFARVGDAIGDVFTDLSDDGVSAAHAVDVAFDALEVTIRGVGHVINFLTESYGLLAKYGAFGRDAQLEFIRLEANAKLAADGAVEAAGGIQQVEEASDGAGDAMQDFITTMQESVEAGQSLYDSQTEVAGAIDKANGAAKDNGRTLDANTEKGRDNRDALSDLATSLRDNYVKYVELNGASGQANVVAEENRRQFIKTARQFGATAGEAEALADEILGIPKTAGTRAIFDDTKAGKEARAYIAMLRNIPAYKRTVLETARVVTNYTGSSSALASALRKQSGRAGGGPVQPGESYVVGERGPEILQMGNRGGNVVPNHALGGAAGGDLYLTLDLGEGITQRLRIDRRDMKRRAAAAA